MVKKMSNYYGSCNPMIEGNEGIWIDEEDPESENYKPHCCTNVYIDLARGKFDTDFEEF